MDEDLIMRDLRALYMSGQEFHLQLNALEAFVLLGAIQLACRHPENSGDVREMVEAIGRGLGAALAVSPALADVVAAGWDPAQDLPVT